LDPGSNGKIRRPLLQLEFEERFTNSINKESVTTITYFVDYYEDISEANSALLAILIVVNIFILFVIGIRIYYITSTTRNRCSAKSSPKI